MTLRVAKAYEHLVDTAHGGQDSEIHYQAIAMSFLKSLGVWSLFTCGPLLVMILPGGRISGAQGLVVLLFLLVALIGAILLQTLRALLKSIKWIVLCGLSLGIALPTLGGFLLWIITPGFESPAILVGALAMAIPSSIGGALAGWIQGRSDAADQKAEVGQSRDQQGQGIDK
jgi:hypothetical protein